MAADKQTVETYNKAAKALATHFQNYHDGVIPKEIELSLQLAGTKVARVVEIGCGAGKDAAIFVKRVTWYEGFDPSGKLLELARQHVPQASFVQADTLSYDYPKDLDIVFACASMIHLNKKDFALACRKIVQALKPGGVFCTILKEADAYKEILQEDKFGKRQFFLYTPQLVRELAGDSFAQVYESHDIVGPEKKRWFSLILQKK